MNLDFLYPILENFNQKDFEEKIKIYQKNLIKFNKVHNLTQIQNIEENIIDSIKILHFFDFTKAKNIVDIGSGAGFPAIFLAFLLKSNFYLFEPNPKKAAFLRTIKIECDLSYLNICKEKAQENKNNIKADVITSRALMDVKPLMQICKDLSSKKTIFILWKGSEIYKELKDLENKKFKIFENGFRRYCILSSQKAT
ncbi:16S rRNA (guanine(527)-N(7))-methyltransferase RsmG [Campylobacter molothri]|uniref:16S rRNA (guanine(527)-N(7))-methyltransferase RsmG n=2 Tax=Campylobacteraceae TaxID=72294 RepID=UPI001EFA5AA3|nr:16S rRNA (guanine(527)-N(7))-methyltransferase RsmG [Campylobacter sp. RM10537]MBZ7949282.1 16S rRNA (guanine(527)-N(7))-methyltransferase RsmG [Campylobacter sp. RM10534]ULN99673.1 16S rRNA m7G527 methyltransferase [Campylobacter sp. RM10537]